jgi:hypothetical protein
MILPDTTSNATGSRPAAQPTSSIAARARSPPFLRPRHGGQVRTDQRAQLNEHARKGITIHASVKMPLDFPFSRNAPKEVFHSAGDRHHAVSLELREVDDNIGLVNSASNIEPAEPMAALHLHSLIELCKSGAFVLNYVHDAGFLAYAAQFAESGTITDKRLGTGLAHEPYCRAYDLGVCGHCINGGLALRRFGDEHPVPRLHKVCMPPSRSTAAYRVKGLAAVIITTPHY